MKSRLSKSDPGDAPSLFAAFDEQSQPLPSSEITMDTLLAIAKSSKRIRGQSKSPLPYLDPDAVRGLPKGTRAFIVVATNAGDEQHRAVTVGVLRPDGARCTQSLYATKKACT